MFWINFLHMLWAILGLGFLIFIHELGHYWMARRVGMRVDTFAIGFGKPIYSWVRDGVKWQIGWLPFGGYVKIAGTETDGNVDPYQVSDGFYGKGPWNRIKVALAGPVVNLVFALLVFTILWAAGGREKPFAENTAKLGWVDPHSQLYAKGIRPGDEITAYDSKEFGGAKDHLYATLVDDGEVTIKGFKNNYNTQQKEAFELSLKPYVPAHALDNSRKSLGVMAPANYLIYMPSQDALVGLQDAPLTKSGIQEGDRIVWVDGELIFSTAQLINVLNDGRALLTIKRQGDVLLARVPRVEAQELKFSAEFKDELMDWQFEADLRGKKLPKLFVLPYNLTNDCLVESKLDLIDADKQQDVFGDTPFSKLESALVPGDRIIAIDGQPVDKAYELLALLQKRVVNIIVQREPKAIQKIAASQADEDFDQSLDVKSIQSIAQTIGSGQELRQASSLVLLKPVEPKKEKDLVRSQSNQLASAKETEKWLQSIEDKDKRAQLQRLLDQQKNKLSIGIVPADRKVNFNPQPLQMFGQVLDEILYTLQALFSGGLSPKWLSGPVGIIQVVQNTWTVGAKEALFWMGAISLNLGMLNLLPIPVLDGGTIVLTFAELVTGRRLKPKTLEKIVLPFAILLIGFFIFVTYHDIARIFSGLGR